MIPSSIRWRLPLSYAATALLAALLLGAILLLGLRGYYSRRESEYVRDNARAVASTVSLLIAPEAPAAALQAQVDLMAFVSQTRVRITDTQGNTLADSGDPRQLRGLGTLSVGLEAPGTSQTLTQTLDGAEGQRRFTSRIDVEETGPQGSQIRTQIDTSVVIVGDALELPGGLGGELGGEAEPISLVPAVGAQLGLDLGRADSAGARRSDKVARQPYHDLGSVAGYVELSLGPAFGTEVLSSVARGWAASGAVAVVLAGAVGWLMSRRITRPLTGLAETTARMSQGDLSARAEVGRSDELGQLAVSFNEMAQRVESTVDALQRFVGDSAHQLLTPMTALRTDFDALRRQPTEAIERATLFSRVSAQLDRLQELSTGLLDLSRLEAGVVERPWTEVDLSKLLTELGESFASRADQSDLELSLSLPKEPLLVMADESQLRQAVGNLIDNAIKFTSVGGQVNVSLRREGSRTLTTVEDTGVGIPEADLAHLFERFHRGRNASTYPGSGLGLAIVRAIATAHGGDVTGENTASGACFAISLPDSTAARDAT
jgi:signal transduction histidine kinase